MLWAITASSPPPLFLSSDDPIEEETSPSEENSSPPPMKSIRTKKIPPREFVEDGDDSEVSTVDFSSKKDKKGKGSLYYINFPVRLTSPTKNQGKMKEGDTMSELEGMDIPDFNSQPPHALSVDELPKANYPSKLNNRYREPERQSSSKIQGLSLPGFQHLQNETEAQCRFTNSELKVVNLLKYPLPNHFEDLQRLANHAKGNFCFCRIGKLNNF